MANSYVRYTGNASTTAFAIPFTFIDSAHLTCTVAGSSTSFTLNAAGTTATLATAPASGAAIEFRRRTSQTSRLTDYVAGSVLKEDDLDTDSIQAFNMSQEAIDDAQDVISLDAADFQWNVQSKRLKTVADPTSAQDASTKNYVDTKFASDITTVAGSATAAANSATASANSATASANSATTSSNAATAAGNAQTAAEAALDGFDDRYLGTKSSDPTVDNDGATLIDGALYFNTTDNTLKVYDLGNTVWKATKPTSAEQTAINTVSTNNANVSTVAGISSDVSTVAGISSDISAVENIAANVTTVAGVSANVTSVAGISSDVTTVAGIASDVSAVENIAANVTTVAGISSNVTTVAGANTNISAVAGGLTNINTVAGAVANVNTVASNVAGVNSFADRYRVAGSAPSSSLDVGDLYFDTSSDTMKVYGGSGWQNAGSSVNGTSARFIFSVSSSATSISGNDTAGNTLAYDAGFVDVWLNGVKMVNGTDVTVTSGNAIVFAVAIGTSGTDTVDVIAYGTFNVANVTSSSLASSSVTTAKIADDAVTVDKLANTINSAITANTAKVTNATHTGEVTGATALTIADNVVDEANLKVSNAPTNGYFLSAQSGNTGGLTWAEAAGGFSFNAVTGATPSLNLGSYNFFDRGATSANTTVSFASVPTEALWTFTFEAGAGTETWDVSKASFEKSFNIALVQPASQGLFFKPDGTVMYTIGETTRTVQQWTLSTAWDVATASYASKEFSVVSQEPAPQGLFFKPDGTIMYVTGTSGDAVSQYALSTAWDVSTASYTKDFSVSTQASYPYDLFFKPDGTSMYIVDEQDDKVYQYTLSTAWDVGTASYASKEFSVGSQETFANGIHFKSDGTTMFVIGRTSDSAYQYTLSTAWDVSTASYASKSIYVGTATGGNPSGIFFKDDGSKMYTVDYFTDTVSQYNIGSLHTLTLPSSVENPPRIPLQFGSRFSYDFFTKDGGTTVTLLSENREDATF